MQSNQPNSQSPVFFKTISRYKFCLRLCISMPCLILWAIIIFIYCSYNLIYVLPLISNTYWYNNNPNTQLTEDHFPIFYHILSLENNLYSFASIEPLNHQKKGWLLFSIMHYLIFWFMISIIRTMRTDPGQTPVPDSPWATKIESLANFYLEEAIKTLKKNKKAELRNFLKKGSLNVINELNINEYSPFPDNTQRLFSEPSRLIKPEEFNKNEPRPSHDRENFHTEAGNYIYNSSSDILSEEFTLIENEEMNKIALEMVMSRECFRYCGFCKSFKPLRTHHCQQCMRCVLKMDHHCQWVLTCIGLRNYKFFMNMIIYGTLILLFFLLTFIRCVMDVALNPYIDGAVIYVTLFAYILASVLFLIVLVFTGFHFWLIYRGKTTLEYFEKDQKQKSEKKKKRKKTIINYDEGKYNNFKAVFNNNPLLWFFPIRPNERVDGLYQKHEDKIIEDQSN